MNLAAYQDAFAQALSAPTADAASPAIAALARQPGFAVYRNTVMKGCVDALQANYPTVEKFVGEEWLRAAAAVFARAHLPVHPSLVLHGAGFPDFLDTFEPAQSLPYLGAVARIDRCRTEAHVAADAPILDPAVLAALDPASLSSRGLRLHPAARWTWSAAWPAHALWQRAHGDGESDSAIEWDGQGVLVTRPFGALQTERVSRAGVALLAACARGASVDEAALDALAADDRLDLSALIRQLLLAGAFTDLQPTSEVSG